jgi:hypothetical protein
MVLRGGYGIFYQHTDRYGSESQMGAQPAATGRRRDDGHDAQRSAGLRFCVRASCR